MLLFLGIWSICRCARRGISTGSRGHSHNDHGVKLAVVDNWILTWGPLVTGALTGLLGTAGVMLLGPVAAASTLVYAGLFILIYGGGILTSMAAYALFAAKLIAWPVAGRKGPVAILVGRVLAMVPGTASVLLGVTWLVNS